MTSPSTTFAVAPLGRAEVLQWLAPAPLWDATPVGAAASGLAQPFIAEFRTDRFAKALLGMLDGSAGSPADLATLVPDTTVDGTSSGAYRLFQPLSQRYYVVSAELVCRRPGIPDHRVDVKAGQRVSFVMRRQDPTTGGELAFVPSQDGGSWVTATENCLTDGEQRHPMHPSTVVPYADPGTTTAGLGLALDGGSGRTLWWGYVPVGVRNTLVRPMDDPAQKLADLRASTPGIADPKLDWLYARIVSTWSMLGGHQDAGGHTVGVPRNPDYGGLFVLLDLGDWIKQQLPVVYDNLANGTALTAGSDYEKLVLAMGDLKFRRSDNVTVSLYQAVQQTLPYAGLVDGQDMAGPTLSYHLLDIQGGNLTTFLGDRTVTGSLLRLAEAALAVAPTPAALPPELEGMVREDAGQPSTIGQGPTYVIRVLLEHDPCCPVLSEASHPFELAKALDADAPARKILLQMPDITNMRSFKRGVAIETPPALQKVLNAVTPDVLKGDQMGTGGVTLGFICSFSLQIIFLVAFIVMFIFLLLLNIVFFWMPFLKICFPVPVPAQNQQGPQP